MATFALTKVTGGKWGNKQRIVYDVTVSGNYTATGDVINIPHFKDITNQIARLEEFNFVNGMPQDGTVAYPATYVLASGKLKFWETGAAINTGLAEKGAESLANVTFRISVIARY